MMRARCSAGSDGSSAPVSFVQGYRHSNAVTHWQGRLSSQKCFSDEIYGLTAQSQAFSMSHIHPAAIRGHQQFIFLMTSRLRLKSSPYNQCCDSGTVTQVWADAGSHSSTSRSSDCIPNFLTGGERIWHTSEASHRTHQEQPCMGRLIVHSLESTWWFILNPSEQPQVKTGHRRNSSQEAL